MNFNFEWILNPLTTYAITGTGLMALLFLWFGAKIEASKCRHEMTAMKKCTDSALQELASKVSEIVARPAPEPPLEYPGMACPGITQSTTQSTTQSLNLTRRARALHMRRRGEEPHTIAAALGISHGEVELLLKLDQMVQRRE
jgi:hypothetical protein